MYYHLVDLKDIERILANNSLLVLSPTFFKKRTCATLTIKMECSRVEVNYLKYLCRSTPGGHQRGRPTTTETSLNYRPKRSFGQGNIFTPVCHSVHRGGEYLIRHTPLGPGTPPGQVHPPGCKLRNTVNDQPVRILLECILVSCTFRENLVNSYVGTPRVGVPSCGESWIYPCSYRTTSLHLRHLMEVFAYGGGCKIVSHNPNFIDSKDLF